MNGGREFLQILSEPVRKQLEKTEISFAGLQEVRIRVGKAGASPGMGKGIFP